MDSPPSFNSIIIPLLKYHSTFIRVQELVRQGALGFSLGKVRHEANILWSFAPRDISMILSFASETSTSVQYRGLLKSRANYFEQVLTDSS